MPSLSKGYRKSYLSLLYPDPTALVRVFLLVASLLFHACGAGGDGARSTPVPNESAEERAADLQARLNALGDELDSTRTLIAGLERQSVWQRRERRNLEIQASILAAGQARLAQALREAEARRDALAQQEARRRQDLEDALKAGKAFEAEKAMLKRQVSELERRLRAGALEHEALAAAKQRVVELRKADHALRYRHPAGAQGLEAALDATREALREAQLEIAMLTRALGVYTVQPGDHLYGIAEFFYRDAKRWPEIVAANAALIGRPEHIRAGSVLVIPR